MCKKDKSDHGTYLHRKEGMQSLKHGCSNYNEYESMYGNQYDNKYYNKHDHKYGD